MQVQHEKTQDELIKELQRQVDQLTTDNLLLKEQLARKEQYTAMIAHELRGPLAPIINYAQMLNRSISMPRNKVADSVKKTLQRNTSIIISQAQRLARLVNDQLDASRLASDQFTLICKPCDMVALAQEVVEQLRPVAPYHTFELDMPEQPIRGVWDEGRLQQALGNLLDNAIKYSDEGSKITLRIHSQEATPQQALTVKASVHNQGVGIAQEDIHQLFRPFGRLEATRGIRQGSGLGLYITKSIIEAHGGKLWLEDQDTSEQAGATFSFQLPLQ
ncbi:sensor histidine kinase [Ktedonospora formicarum]|uniref:histidine kinase n=1 Tax=Ktedonospora formicarum TaxID=2778364 RepID=A0A8J3I099_9CHLR|nr:HAMP domain-containing sensor histidine kinase [Ktedonospora formicarum]GHO43882.1 hypothetical protein KSX_20450 [Ktedonospora formicarum]